MILDLEAPVYRGRANKDRIDGQIVKILESGIFLPSSTLYLLMTNMDAYYRLAEVV